MYHSIKDIINISDEENKPFWQVVMESDMQERGVTADISYAAMEKLYAAMKKADDDYRAELISASGLVGGDGGKLHIMKPGRTFAVISSAVSWRGQSRWASQMRA